MRHTRHTSWIVNTRDVFTCPPNGLISRFFTIRLPCFNSFRAERRPVLTNFYDISDLVMCFNTFRAKRRSNLTIFYYISDFVMCFNSFRAERCKWKSHHPCSIKSVRLPPPPPPLLPSSSPPNHKLNPAQPNSTRPNPPTTVPLRLLILQTSRESPPSLPPSLTHTINSFPFRPTSHHTTPHHTRATKSNLTQAQPNSPTEVPLRFFLLANVEAVRRGGVGLVHLLPSPPVLTKKKKKRNSHVYSHRTPPPKKNNNNGESQR